MNYPEFMATLESAASQYDSPPVFDVAEEVELLPSFDEDFASIFEGRD